MTPPEEGVCSERGCELWDGDNCVCPPLSTPPVILAQIVAALSVSYTDDGVLAWLTATHTAFASPPGMGFPNGRPCSAQEFIAAGRIDEVAEAVRRIGDADPSDFKVSGVVS